MLALPLLVKAPSRIDRSAPVRALTTVGVISYALLIVNDPMRLVASQLRVEDVPGAVWWAFLVAVYVPLSVVLAWPLAKVLGLLPPSAGQAEARRAGRTLARAALAGPADAAEAVV